MVAVLVDERESVLPSLASRGGWGSAAVEEVEVTEEEGSTSMVLTAEWCPRVERTASTGHSKNRGQRNTHSEEHTHWMFRYQWSTLVDGNWC